MGFTSLSGLKLHKIDNVAHSFISEDYGPHCLRFTKCRAFLLSRKCTILHDLPLIILMMPGAHYIEIMGGGGVQEKFSKT